MVFLATKSKNMMENFDKEKLKERIGVGLLCLTLILSGLLLIKGDAKESKFEESVLGESDSTSTISSNDSVSKQEPATQSKTKIQGKININTASIEDLDTLPGIGEKTAQKILNYRETNGAFKSISEIKEVSGIGDVKYEGMKDLISI